MNFLRTDHPAQLVWGFLLETEAQAACKQQAIFGFLAEVARPAVLEVRELFTEISREAGELVMLGDEYMRDGAIDSREWAGLRRRAEEIELEAREGRIIP